jgi:hypothetical protein
MLATTSCGKNLTLIAALWNIIQQNESNRRRTADRVRDDCAGKALAATLAAAAATSLRLN